MTFYDTLIKKERASFADIVYNSGIVSVFNNGIIAYLEIIYSGSVRITSLMPSSYHLFASSSKIIIILFGDEDMPEDIFRYDGKFKIKKATARNMNGEKVRITIKEEGLREWNLSETKWEDATYTWDSAGFVANSYPRTYIDRQSSLLNKAKRVSLYQKPFKGKKALKRQFKPVRKPIEGLIKEYKIRKEEKKIQRKL